MDNEQSVNVVNEILYVDIIHWNLTTERNYSNLTDSSDVRSHLPVVSVEYVALFATLFFVVGMIGVAGNLMVIYIVLEDKKMRKSVTNLLILNLALADSLIMVFGIPEIVLFMLNQGWLLGLVMCKIQRTVLVGALYSSVLTLVTVCIERYIAIVFPIKAHIVCTKRRVIFVIMLVWTLSLLCASPTAVFNMVVPSEIGVHFCLTNFPGSHLTYMKLFKYSESILFYFGPLLVQLVCYIVIGKRLFIGVERLHRQVMSPCDGPNRRIRTSEAIKARRGVVKMLIASVIIYFLSYSPHQVLLFYNSFSAVPFHQTWVFLVLTTTLAYINSAANPILYCVFSQNFRKKFHVMLCRAQTCHGGSESDRMVGMNNYTEYTTLFRRSTKKPALNNFKHDSAISVV
ncbi:neuropeptide receptor 15-like [Gigantopelta aegis]|uniref:neuropeptide receptor 15-like n=1 Tax=Gigantopelta aegis TaxID=1735272 RepID=UPI001B8896F8|nr:neuropeptide receptor 15-like [Gigantopelta aegis]